MKFTYANVMSTIAMFAAVTTGSSYAAATLAANSVTTKQIKNGQVGTADLSPALRKQIAAKPATGGGTTAKPVAGGLLPVGQWTNTGALAASSWVTNPQSDGRINLASQIGTTGNVEFRLVGTITKGATGSADVTLVTLNSKGSQTHGLGWFGPAGIGTFTPADFQLNAATATVPAADAANVEATYSAADGATSTMRIEVRRLG